MTLLLSLLLKEIELVEIIFSTTPSVTAAAPNHTSAAASRADLMNTLNGLLHRLNIPTDMQEGSLMDKLVSLNETNAKLENDYAKRCNRIEGREQMNKMTAAIKCQICVTEEVSHVMAPCGHTICLTCLQQLPRNKCPFLEQYQP